MDTYGDAGGYGDVGELYGGDISPATVVTVVTVPTPIVAVGEVVTPAAVVTVVTVPTPTIAGSVVVTPVAVVSVTTVPTPIVLSPFTVTPTVIARSFTIPTPTASGGTAITPAVVARSFTVPTPVGYAPNVGEIQGGGNLWLETWTRPGSAVFERLAVNIPGPFNFTKRAASGIGQGDMTVPATWDRINDVIKRVPGSPGSDIRTLNRAFIEQPTNAPPRIAYEWFNDVTGDETREDFTQIQGPGIESLMADGIVYPWDWDGSDESTSTFPDWVWGGKDIVGPVRTSYAPGIYSVWIEAAATGTATIDIDLDGAGFESATVAPGDSSFEVEQAIEALTFGITAEVIGNGTEESPWQIRLMDPPGTYSVAISSAGLTGGRIFIVQDQFGKVVPVEWTESRVGSTTIPHGVVTDFRASLGGGGDPALPAGCEAWVVFLGQEWYYPGVQTIRNVVPGGIYYLPPVYLYAQGDSADLRVVIRDLNENLLAYEEITVPANTLTQTTGIWTGPAVVGGTGNQIMVPAGVHEIVYRVGHIGLGTPPRIFVACPSVREGLVPTTAGGIFEALFEDATVNHVADGRVVWENLASAGTSYLDLTFDVTFDSDGQPWDEPELTFTAQRGKTYLQVLTDLNHLGYLWSVTPSVTPGRWEVNLYNPGWLDVDATLLQTPAINIGSGVTGGPIFRSHLTGNVITIEGAQMQFGRSESSASIGAIGRKESYQPDRALLTAQMATVRAAEEVASRLLSGLSVSVTVDPVHGPVPLLDYDVDWLINVQIPPVLDKSAHRLASITVNVAETTQYKLAFSSEAFTGSQGVIEAVRRLMLKFEGLERIPPELRDTPRDTPIINRTGGSTAIVIAAYNTNAELLPMADYICTGVNDQLTIEAALTYINLNDFDLTGTYGEIIFLSGDYYFDSYCSLGNNAFGKLTFKGEGTPIFHLNHNTVAQGVAAPMFLCAGSLQSTHMQLRFINIHFHGEDQTNGAAFVEYTTQIKPVMIVESCIFTDFGQNLWWSERPVRHVFRDNYVRDCVITGGAFFMDFFASGPIMISSNIFDNCSGNMISGSLIGSHALVHGNMQTDTGSMVLNPSTLVIYTDNVGF